MATKAVWRDYKITWKDPQNQIHKTGVSIVGRGKDYIKSLTFQSIHGIQVKSIINIQSIKPEVTI